MSILELPRFQEILEGYSKIEPIMVVGDVGIDKYTFGKVRRISPEAPVPVLEVTDEWMKLGLASNVADNLKSLDVNSTLVSVIGSDPNGSIFESLLEEQGLSTWGIVRDDNRSTTVKERVLTDIQQVCRVDYEDRHNISTEATHKVLSRFQDMAHQHSAFIVEDFSKGLVNRDLIQGMLERLKGTDTILAVDPGRDTPPQIYKGVTFFKPNRREAQLIAESFGYFNESSIEKLAEIIVDKLDVEKLVITLGPDGMALLDRKDSGKLKIIPTAAKEVFDVSGAGDTAISTIVASLCAGASLEEAAIIGNCASGVVVGKKGTAKVNQKELESFYLSVKDEFKQNNSH